MVIKKVCIKCHIEKPITEFYKNKINKDGHRNNCIKCKKEHADLTRDLLNAQAKSYYAANKETIAKSRHEYYHKNAQYKKEYAKQYRKANKQELNNKYYARRNKDCLFKLSCNIRTLICHSFRKNGYKKNSKANKILCCSFEEFKEHIERQFTEGMSWENQGEWHLDHIYPVSLAESEEHLIKLNHYTNFQPLWAIDNFKKGNKVL